MTTPLDDPHGDEPGEAAGPESRGRVPEPPGHPSRLGGRPAVRDVRRLSTISEREPDKADADLGRLDGGGGGSGWGGSSQSFSTDDSYYPASGDDCAALLLACLHCRFHALAAMLPDVCGRAASRCFPSCKYAKVSSGREQPGGDCCGRRTELDRGCTCGSCQDAAQLLEPAMEISQICYR